MHVVRNEKAYTALKKDPRWESPASNIDDIPRLTGGLEYIAENGFLFRDGCAARGGKEENNSFVVVNRDGETVWTH